MATYFHGSSEIEAADNGGGLHKLYILNPNFIPNYSTTTQDAAAAAAAANTLILNPMGNGVSPSMVQPHHAPSPNQHHHFVGIPLSTGAMTFGPNHGSVDDPSHPSSPHGFSLTTSLHDMDPRPQSYPCGRQLPDPSLSSDHLLQVGEPSSSGAAFLPSWQQRGLSLSLSTEHQPQRPSFTPRNSSSSSVPKSALGVLQPHPIQTIPGSKYLRAVQELLDEVVNVEKDTRNTYSGIDGDKMKSNVESSKDVASSSGGDHERSDHHVKGSGAGGDGDHPLVGTAQRQELQMKKTKLMNMLDEVEHRYKQYHHQMQLVVSSFERATSVGAAKSYTSLALKTISRQFRCLKDVLVAQIKATSKSLGDDDCLGKKLEGSRLKYVDNHLRQQRALQQLGMIHHNNNAWRPQRGLPERAVTVLRAWLFEHFLHPYPKDSDKHMLAKQTGLTRSQVSNWFINARVRLWKPMVEEMYLEETKSQEQTGSKDDTISKTTMEPDKGLGSTTIPQDDGAFRSMNLTRAFQSSQGMSLNGVENLNSISSTLLTAHSLHPLASGITMIELSDPEEIGIAQTSPKRLRINSSNIRDSPSGIVISKDTDMPMRDMNREVGNQCSVLDAFSQENVTSFNADIGGRSYGSGVSLTLGLQHFAKPSLSSPTPQHFMPNVQTMNHHLGRRFLGVNNAETADFFSGINAGQEQSQPTSSTNYEAIDIDNRKRFVAAQLLPDYVAL